MSAVARSLLGLAVLGILVAIPGCCWWKELTDSQEMIDEPPTVDIKRYKTLAVVSVRPMPGDPAVTEVEARLVKFGTPQGLKILKGDQLGRLQQMMNDRLAALQAQTNFQQQMAQRQAEELTKVQEDAARENMSMARDAQESNAAYTAYAAASEGISTQYVEECKQIFAQAAANAEQFGIPPIDGIIFVDLKDFGRPSYFAMAGGYGGYGGNIKTVTLAARIGWSLVDPASGAIIHSDLYEIEESAVAEVGATVQGASGQFAFDLGGLQKKLWDAVGYKVSENFYPHQRPECEEKGGVER